MTTARYATEAEIQDWDTLILRNPDGGNIFSSAEYALIKRLTQYRARYVVVGSGATSVAVTVLEKSVPPLGKLWYLPKGPGVSSPKALLQSLHAIEPLAKKAGAFVVRAESELPRSSAPGLQRHGLKRAAPIIPNPSTITVDLAPSLDAILLGLPQKGRHALRRAERDGVTIKQVAATNQNTRRMYNLLAETAQGQFGIRSYDYYRQYWQTFQKASLGQLFFAYYDGNVVAGAYAMVFGTKSTYKDGASVRERTAYGASHLLQWEVMRWAKQRGALVHDLCGAPPSDEIDNPNHPHYGIGRFKLSLSRNVVDYIGCYDLVVSKSRYYAWQKGVERLYRHFYYKRTGDYYY